MHGPPRQTVERLILGGGGTLLHVEEDRMAGAEWVSFTYTARRP